MAASQAATSRQAVKQQRQLFYAKTGFDMPFFIILLVMLAVGLICLYSASYAYAYKWENNDSYYYIRRQLVFAGVGLVALLAASAFNYQKWHVLAIPLMGVSVILLAVVLFLPAENGIHRWIRFSGVQFQPSEIGKFALIVLFAHLMSLNHKKMNTFRYGVAPFMGILLMVAGLVFLEPHLSGTILLVAIGLVMMWVGGTRPFWLLLVVAIGVAAVLFMVFGLGYEQDRIAVWQDPLAVEAADPGGAAWQTVQSLYAIGSGGLMGQGLGNSRQKHLFLPEPHNDFIFAVICEELGMVGAILIMVLFGLLVWRGFVIGMRARDKFGSLLAVGLSAQVGIQALLNMAVVTNAFPNTGISLPFFSYGGTSLMMLMAQMGVVLAVSRQGQKP